MGKRPPALGEAGPSNPPPPYTPRVPAAPARSQTQASATASISTESRSERPLPALPTSEATSRASLSSTGKKPLSGTYSLDPSLRNPFWRAPHALRTTTDATLSSLEAYGDGSFNWITGAPVNGLARIAKKHILPPDAVFESENGGVSLKIGVVDAVGAAAEEAELADEVEETNAEGKKEKKRRTRARVAINTERGGVLLEITEIAPTRQLDVDITTAAGDILVLLPPDFCGPVRVNAPDEPEWGPALKAATGRVVMTGEGMWTATVGAQAAENNSWGNKAADKVASRAPKAVERAQRGFKALLPDAVGSITGFIDDTLGTVLGGEYVTSGMVAAGYGAVSKERQSRIVIHTEKGTVLLGFAGTGDASRVRELEMRVGADSKPKSWWKSTF